MILLLLLLIPVVAGLSLFLFRKTAVVRLVSLVATLLNLGLTVYLAISGSSEHFASDWITFMGARFDLAYDGISMVMLLLTNLLFPFILLAGFNREQQQVDVLNFLILLTQSALIGVFLAQSAFLFYIFWELTLIPIYFILLLWGGEKRRNITLKFFIYTLSGSLFLLFGIIYLYHLTPGVHTSDFSALNQLSIPESVQIGLFWVLFIAFAIKMPVFPFHTWQPSTYTMASGQGVMILAGVMTKMGLYGALRFLWPIIPQGVLFWQNTVIVLALTGVVYASIIAFRQSDLKRLVAFSSMAHISLMAAALFVVNAYTIQGIQMQVISHGITIVALFYLVELVFERAGTLDLNRLGGIKLQAPRMAIVLLIVVLGSVSLPLTAGFVGEFLILTGLFKLSLGWALFGGTAMILGAVYMLYAYQRVMLGDHNPSLSVKELSTLDYIILIPLITLILVLGVYPQPVLDLLGHSISGYATLIP